MRVGSRVDQEGIRAAHPNRQLWQETACSLAILTAHSPNDLVPPGTRVGRFRHGCQRAMTRIIRSSGSRISSPAG